MTLVHRVKKLIDKGHTYVPDPVFALPDGWAILSYDEKCFSSDIRKYYGIHKSGITTSSYRVMLGVIDEIRLYENVFAPYNKEVHKWQHISP